MSEAPIAAALTAEMPDVQGGRAARHLPIQRVGVRNVRYPLQVRERGGNVQATVATLSMHVSLEAERRGAHLSRFVELLDGLGELDMPALRRWLAHMLERLESVSGGATISFPYFREKAAPVSGVRSLLDYEVTISGELEGEHLALWLEVRVPVTSLCPCSKTISRYGAHSQRSYVTVRVPAQAVDCIEDLIDLIEAQASCEVYALLKRSDERFVTERAYDNPKFVEDMVRDVAARLEADARFASYRVECENLESIHNHSAYALIARGGGSVP